MAGIYLVLGANLGNRKANIEMALRMLEPIVRVEAVSPFYESPPQPPAPPPPYVNAAARAVTGLDPLLLLRHVKRIERMIGRVAAERWAPRPIDIDIALFDEEVVDLTELQLPHPRLLERAFFLRPLLDLEAELRHPITGTPLSDALAVLGEGGLERLPRL